MLEPIISFFDKLIDQFTWRRLIFFALLLAIVGGAIWAYEDYTQQFKLARIEKQILLLEKLSVVAAKPEVTSNPMLASIQSAVEHELVNTTQVSATKFELEPWVKKVLAAMVPWLIFGVFVAFIPKAYTVTQPAATSVVAGMTVFALPFVAAAAWLPTAPWINYVIYPIGHIFAIIIVLLWFSRLMQRKFKSKVQS